MKSDQGLKNKVLHGSIWKLSEKVGVQITQFIIQIVLARLLLPDDYGIIGLVTIFITISDVFIQQGLPTALVQKKEVDELDYSSVFYSNMIVSFCLYGILYAIAPLISKFYSEPILVNVMRILALNIMIGAISAVHNAILTRHLEFKKSFLGGLLNTFTQGIAGIIFALKGYGVWALVLSKVMGTLVGTSVLCILVRWHPAKCFSIKRIKILFSYGSKVLGTNLLNTIFNNIHSLIIGKFFAKSDLGYYQRGQQIPQTIMVAIDGSINEVLYPTLSHLQEELRELKNTLRRSLKLSMFIVMPMLFGLYATAENIVLILLTEKWLKCVPFMQLTCIICMFWPLSSCTNALNALGRSDITFKLSIISKMITIVLILICIRWGIYAIMLGTIGASLISFWFTAYYAEQLIGYKLREVICDILPSICLAIVMSCIVWCVSLLSINIYIELLLQIFVGSVTYCFGAKIFKIDCFEYLCVLMKNLIRK